MKPQKASKSKSTRPGARLELSAPADLQRKVQELQLAIARRAHELFEARGCEHGHDLEDWLRAESELLCPVSIAMSESQDRVSVRANVTGFDRSEVEACVEPHRITILGKRKPSIEKREPGGTEQDALHPDRVLQVIDLAIEVVPERAIVELLAGELIFELQAVRNKSGTAA
ncbi:MAG: DUF2934 domain-containing protein [Candidatus Sulfotelmatobacter sp.]